MSEPRKAAVAKATRRLTVPLAKFYLRSGLKFADYEEAARRAFVAAAVLQARENGDAATITQLATLTGFTRAEVRRLKRGAEDAPLPMREAVAQAQRVIDGWLSDPRFNKQGQPLELPVRGPIPSMVTLIRCYAGNDQRAKPILRELERAGAVCRLENGRYKLLRKTCTNVPGDPGSIASIADDAGTHLRAGLENIQESELEPHFVRFVRVDNIDPEHARILMKRFQENAQVLIESANQTLAQRRYKANPEKGAQEEGVGFRIAVQILKQSRSGKLLRQGEKAPVKRRRKDSGATEHHVQRGGRS